MAVRGPQLRAVPEIAGLVMAMASGRAWPSALPSAPGALDPDHPAAISCHMSEVPHLLQHMSFQLHRDPERRARCVHASHIAAPPPHGDRLRGPHATPQLQVAHASGKRQDKHRDRHRSLRYHVLVWAAALTSRKDLHIALGLQAPRMACQHASTCSHCLSQSVVSPAGRRSIYSHNSEALLCTAAD